MSSKHSTFASSAVEKSITITITLDPLRQARLQESVSRAGRSSMSNNFQVGMFVEYWFRGGIASSRPPYQYRPNGCLTAAT